MPESINPRANLLASFATARFLASPYRHWLLNDALPDATLDKICSLPLEPPAIMDTQGRRETHNSSRLFFSHAQQQHFPVCAALTAALQSRDCVANLQALTGATLKGSFLRVEYCLDTDGFWLEPHTDIGAKLFTMLIYLNDAPPGEDWGTDIYDNPTQKRGPAPAGHNHGLIFVPGQNTWHGFEKRRITGVRRTLIINYVTPEWRARHELAFPATPIA
ncbi:2OG-Fe(II) oxygenase [Acidocella sp.]|uniref:2OG-Fe(II) oxygenase n=1 Tax=Acidocella sp. TaxID=50710 RepID=UPI003D0016E9